MKLGVWQQEISFATPKELNLLCSTPSELFIRDVAVLPQFHWGLFIFNSFGVISSINYTAIKG